MNYQILAGVAILVMCFLRLFPVWKKDARDHFLELAEASLPALYILVALSGAVLVITGACVK